MERIAIKDIQKINGRVNRAKKDPFKKMQREFKRQQPVLNAYLNEIITSHFEGKEGALFYHVALLVWRIVDEVIGCEAEVSENYINVQIDRNTDLFEAFFEKERNPEEFVEMLYVYNKEPNLTEFMVGFLSQAEEDGGGISEESFPMMVMHLKTLVDCLVLDEEEWGIDFEREFSDEKLGEVKELMKSYGRSFEKSKFYKNLSREEKKNSPFILTAFGEMMYGYHGRMPEQWKMRHVIDCCINIMPRKIADDTSFFETVIPVLTAFFNFAAIKDLIPRASLIAEELPEFKEELMAVVTDPDSWGVGKSLIMEAQEAGVDLEDEEAFRRFVEKKNEGLVEQDDMPGFFHGEKVGRNDPCPCGSGKKFKKCCGADL